MITYIENSFDNLDETIEFLDNLNTGHKDYTDVTQLLPSPLDKLFYEYTDLDELNEEEKQALHDMHYELLEYQDYPPDLIWTMMRQEGTWYESSKDYDENEEDQYLDEETDWESSDCNDTLYAEDSADSTTSSNTDLWEPPDDEPF